MLNTLHIAYTFCLAVVYIFEILLRYICRIMFSVLVLEYLPIILDVVKLYMYVCHDLKMYMCFYMVLSFFKLIPRGEL